MTGSAYWTRAWLDEARRRAATAGTSVTTSEGSLDDLPEGEWDLVLCHSVLRYREIDAGDVAARARRVRIGGRLSIMDVNPAGRVLSALLNEGPAAARAEFQADRATVETFRVDTRRIDPDAVLRDPAAAGLGGRSHDNHIANDLLVDDAAKGDLDHFDDRLPSRWASATGNHSTASASPGHCSFNGEPSDPQRHAPPSRQVT